jgi:hypothetical protein
MSIKLNDNIKINAGKPSESKYLTTGNTAYISINDVNIQIPIAERYIGLTVLIDSGTTNLEHWYNEGVQNTDLVEKKFSSEQVTSDFITGATNLGYFSGYTGIQHLDLSGSGFILADRGSYYSEYNWYYVDGNGIIRIGNPTYGGPLRRVYVNTTRTKSWIWNVDTDAWEISSNDVVNNVGNSVIISSHSGYIFTGITWSGSEGNAVASVTADGSLTTGDTLTIGNPTYSYQSNQDLHFRTIINDTPEFIKIENDNNYIHFSGVSSVVNGQNFGNANKVFTGKTGSNLGFRTLKQSGDTSISLDSDGSLVIYSSSNGSADAITGVTNVGSGIGVYSGTTDRNIQLKKLIGTGNTTVTDSGDTIIIDSTGGSSTVFTEDITVSIANGKTFGKYENGDTIPASGKTPNDIILMSLAEALDPTVNLSHSLSGTDIRFGLDNKTVNVTFSYVINTIGASVASAVLEWKREGVGSWVELTSDTGDTSYLHIINDSGDRFNTADINYRYTVTDTEGASTFEEYNVTLQPYAAPTISSNYLPLSFQIAYETKQLREIGNVDTTITGNIESNNDLVNLLEYRIQRDDGTGYVTVASETGFNLQNKSITSYLDVAATSDTTTITYRVQVDDEWTTTTSAVYTINLRYSSYFGYNTNTVLTSGQIIGLGNNALLSSRVRTIDPVTAPANNYTFISYPASFGDLTNVIMDGSSPVLGSFTKLTNVSVINFYGETVSNIIYKSNAPEAFTDNELAFS